MSDEKKIDQRVFDLYDEYCHGQIDRREFLGKADIENKRIVYGKLILTIHIFCLEGHV